MSYDKDKRPEKFRDDASKTPPTKAKEKWHNPTETMDEGPASDPNAEKQSRTS